MNPPFFHTQTGLLERGLRAVKDNLLTFKKEGQKFSRALDITQDVMRNNQHTKFEKFTFEMHNGRKPKSWISNLVYSDNLMNLTEGCKARYLTCKI